MGHEGGTWTNICALQSCIINSLLQWTYIILQENYCVFLSGDPTFALF